MHSGVAVTIDYIGRLQANCSRSIGLEGFVLIAYLEEKWIEFTKGPLKVRDDISFCSNTFSESLVALSNYIEANSLKIH